MQQQHKRVERHFIKITPQYIHIFLTLRIIIIYAGLKGYFLLCFKSYIRLTTAFGILNKAMLFLPGPLRIQANCPYWSPGALRSKFSALGYLNNIHCIAKSLQPTVA